jgi:acyl dehydratase
MERLWAFSGGPFALEGWPRRNLHTDPSVAASVGLPSVGASGTQYQGYIVELMLDLFGEAWLSHGSMTGKFIALVNAGETVQAHAEVVETEAVDGGQVRFTLKVWCENGRGEQVLVGRSIGLLG